MPSTNTAPATELEEVKMRDNDYLVTGRLDGGDDMMEYVQAPTAVEAEDIFRDWIQHKYQASCVEVFFESVVQIQGPPVAIFDKDGVRENIQPIKRPE